MRTLDWAVVGTLCLISLVVGLLFARRSSTGGAAGYFTGGRNLPWWAIGLSNTATYQSGNGGFVMLVLVYGLAGNWLWWSSWILWMPLVAIIWARLWRRMQIVTTAELITLRYGGPPAQLARKVYAVVCCFGFSVLLIGYVTGFFAKTIAPLCTLSTAEILLIFGGVTIVYTMFGGLVGVVYVDVVQFLILLLGSTAFLLMAVPQHGGWDAILERITAIRPESLAQTPPTRSLETLTIVVLMLQGLFFAGSPTAGEGMTAQRFMAARNERHAIGGQLFNAFLALTLRTLPLVGLGVIALSLFWTTDPAAKVGAMPAGMTLIDDPAHAWGELVKQCRLPLGFVGLLVAAEVAAYMSTLSSLVNWGGSFVVNDLLPRTWKDSPQQIWISRLTTLVLFGLAAVVTILFVNDMVSWFMFINSAMVIFLLPLSWLRFFWWRFNVWGELAAIVLGLPLSILVWFVLDFQDPERPMWQGLGLLFGLSFIVLFTVTLLTPPESRETLKRFYARCRPPGFWGPIAREIGEPVGEIMPTRRLAFDAALGVFACLGLVLATNAVFVLDWTRTLAGAAMAGVLGTWLISRMLDHKATDQAPESGTLTFKET
ncbi:MAG: sodium:solute symporter [Phycisphaerae bacterium]|nr:sodium:solute symporter [Phycisphaerae bacterium]